MSATFDVVRRQLELIDVCKGGVADWKQVDSTLRQILNEDTDEVCHYIWDDEHYREDACNLLAKVWFITDGENCEWFWDTVVPWMCEQIIQSEWEFICEDEDGEIEKVPYEDTLRQIHWVMTHNCGFESYYAWLHTWEDDDDKMLAQAIDIVSQHYKVEWEKQGYPDGKLT